MPPRANSLRCRGLSQRLLTQIIRRRHVRMVPTGYRGSSMQSVKVATGKTPLILITWDEWGGWYDGVPPPQLDYATLGMRVPLIIISPYAKKHYVSKTQYEFGSILKFIEQNFGTGSLGSTDVRANSIGDALDFTQQPSAFKPIPILRQQTARATPE